MSACAPTMVAAGRSKLGSGAMMRMARYHSELADPVSRSAAMSDTLLATVEVSAPTAVDSLAALGIEVVTTFGDFAIVRLPLAKVGGAVEIGGVRTIDFGNEARPMLDRARKAANVDGVHAGTPEQQPYTGKGVVVGVMDTGVDPLHPAFLDEEGEPRVKFFGNITTAGIVKKSYDRAGMEKQETDTEDATHGTHVAGIAGGSRLPDGRALVPIYSEPDKDGKVSIKEIGPGVFPYYGVAPEADLMLCGTPKGYESALLLGMKTIIDEAVKAGKPAVVNLSFGSNYGPHDGTGTFSRAVSQLGRDAIIVIAAGNEGSDNISLVHKCEGDALTFRTVLDLSKATLNNPLNPQFVFFYSDAADKSLKVDLVAVNTKTGEKVFTIPVYEDLSEDLGENSYYPFSDGDVKKIEKYYKTKGIGGVVRLSPDNGNRMAMLYFEEFSRLSSNRNVALTVEVTSEEGVTVMGFTNTKCLFTDSGMEGYIGGTPEMSISDMATGSNIITVGSFNSRNMYPAIGDKMFYGWEEKTVPLYEPTYFSSYGYKADGAVLPMVSAPGMTIVSALSRYYTAGVIDNKQSAKVLPDVAGGLPAYYEQMSGTSMATPFVTGTIALWLEADPTLTCSDVADIIAKTSIQDDKYDPARMGAGRIDALAGLKEVLARKYGNGIGGVSADKPDEAVFTTAQGQASAFMAGASSVTLTAFTPSGIPAARVAAQGSEATLDTSSLAPGIYILHATDGRRSSSHKISVR